MMMVRPHAGGFAYAKYEVSTMLRDIKVAKEKGAHRVVFGALRDDGRVDRDSCQRLMEAARPLSVTLHRAFDVTPDPFETLLDRGVDRFETQLTTALA